MAPWRSGLTHIPLKDTFKGSNPFRVTKIKNCIHMNAFFIDCNKKEMTIFLYSSLV